MRHHPDDFNDFGMDGFGGSFAPPDAYADDVRSVFGPGATEPEDANPPLAIIAPSKWHGKPVPPREWLVPSMVPAKTVTMIQGDGAAGKSTLALQLAIALASGKSWLGMTCKPGRTLYLSAEDDEDEMHRRVDALAKHYDVPLSDLSDLMLVDLVGAEAVLGEAQRVGGVIRPTKLYGAVEQAIKDNAPDLVIIDSLADAFGGNENERQQARQFVGLLKRLCKLGVTVFVISHPSLSGMASGSGTSGSTAWNNSVRSRLYFETDKGGDGREPDTDLRTLTTKKANYAPMGGQMRVRYQKGAFVVQDGGTPADAKARAKEARSVFMDLLRFHNETDQTISQNTGHKYAPTQFAKHPHNMTGITKAEFNVAMQNLLADKRIKNVKEGPKSRPINRLVVVEREYGK